MRLISNSNNFQFQFKTNKQKTKSSLFIFFSDFLHLTRAIIGKQSIEINSVVERCLIMPCLNISIAYRKREFKLLYKTKERRREKNDWIFVFTSIYLCILLLVKSTTCIRLTISNELFVVFIHLTMKNQPFEVKRMKKKRPKSISIFIELFKWISVSVNKKAFFFVCVCVLAMQFPWFIVLLFSFFKRRQATVEFRCW